MRQTDESKETKRQRQALAPSVIGSFSTELLDEAVLNQPTAMADYRRDVGIVAQKITTLMEFHVQNTDPDKNGFYLLPKQVVREFIGWDDSNNYQPMYDAFCELHKRTIEWNCREMDPDYEVMRMNVIISSMSPSPRGRYIKFEVHPRIEKLIKSPTSHSKVRVVVAPLLRHQHSFAMFELLSDAVDRSGIWSVKIEDLRYRLAIPEGSYSEFKYFRRDVLDRVIAEINEKTELFVEYKTERESRRVAILTFMISRQPWQVRDDLKNKKHLLAYLEETTGFTPERLALKLHRDSLVEMGLTEQEAQRALLEHGFERLQRNIQAANAYMNNLGDKLNTSRSSIYLKAIEKDWAPHQSGRITDSQVKPSTRRAPRARADSPPEIDIETVFAKFESEQKGEERAALVRRFEKYLSSNWIVGERIYNEYGLSHKDIKPYFVRWLVSQK